MRLVLIGVSAAHGIVGIVELVSVDHWLVLRVVHRAARLLSHLATLLIS